MNKLLDKSAGHRVAISLMPDRTKPLCLAHVVSNERPSSPLSTGEGKIFVPLLQTSHYTNVLIKLKFIVCISRVSQPACC